jgi:hypothetical protein
VSNSLIESRNKLSDLRLINDNLETNRPRTPRNFLDRTRRFMVAMPAYFKRREAPLNEKTYKSD